MPELQKRVVTETTLKLTEEESTWLRYYMQNSFQSPEPAEDARMRQAFWQVLSGRQ